MPDKRVILHYGTKGMRWGVRRSRSAASAARKDAASLKKHGYSKEAKALLANAKALDAKNAAASTSKGKGLFKSVLGNKIFKTVIYDHEQMKSNVAGVKKLKAKIAAGKKKMAKAKKERKAAKVKATRKLIKELVADDAKMAKKWGKKYDAAEATRYWEKLFASDLQG